LLTGWGSRLESRAADDLREATSLKFAPADAAFYSTVLRNKEQVEIFLASNAYDRLRRIPLVTFGLSMLDGQWQNSEEEAVLMLKDWWDKQENRKLVDVVLDAVSHEIFLYGDRNYIELLRAAQELQQGIRKLQFAAAQQGDGSDVSKEELHELILPFLKKLGAMKLPTTVVGFKVSNPAAVNAEIDRLETLLNELIERQTELQILKGHLKRETIGDGSFLTLSLTGSLIPWEALAPDAQEYLDEQVQGLISKLKASFSLGVKDGYLLVCVGESVDHLRRMGQGPLLVDRQELAPLRQHADRRVTSVAYASGEFAEMSNSASRQLDDLVANLEAFAPLSELDEETTNAALAEVREFVTEVKSFIPKAGTGMTFAFLTDRGYESFRYDWTENRVLDGSHTLDILNHVGGDPLAFVAARGKYAPEDYEWCVKWIGRIWRRAEPIALERFTPEERQQFEQIRDRAIPLLKRFDQTTRESLLPALRDGQVALVVDGKAKSRQWQAELPSTRVPLPMLEFAMVYGVSDPAALRQAAREYFAITQEALRAAHELSDQQVPLVELASPEVSNTNNGDLYRYPLPAPLALDAQVAPNAGLSEKILVFSLLPDQTKRLLASTPWKGAGTIAATDRSLAAASYCNLAGVFTTITPWINYGVRVAVQTQAEELPQLQMAAQMVAGNLTPITDLLKCLGESASVTYVEGDALVTHSATYFADQ
jgi:hypothetical protein